MALTREQRLERERQRRPLRIDTSGRHPLPAKPCKCIPPQLDEQRFCFYCGKYRPQEAR